MWKLAPLSMIWITARIMSDEPVDMTARFIAVCMCCDESKSVLRACLVRSFNTLWRHSFP